MKKIVDAMGDVCPIPVVKTKDAIKTLPAEGGVIETLVDNEIAVQNLTKMAEQKAYRVASEKIAEGQYKVTMTVGAPAEVEAEGPETCIPDKRNKKAVVVIGTNVMGNGDDTLGAALMKSFVFALSQQDELPSTMLFYNGGAKLTCGNSPMIEDLKSMEAQGVEILTCGTCLNHYGLTDQLAVGSVTNMYIIVEKQMQADRIIKP